MPSSRRELSSAQSYHPFPACNVRNVGGSSIRAALRLGCSTVQNTTVQCRTLLYITEHHCTVSLMQVLMLGSAAQVKDYWIHKGGASVIKHIVDNFDLS